MDTKLVHIFYLYFQICIHCTKPLSIKNLFNFQNDITSCTIVLVELDIFPSDFRFRNEETIGNLIVSGGVFQRSINISPTFLWIINKSGQAMFETSTYFNSSQYLIEKVLHRKNDACQLIFSDLYHMTPEYSYIQHDHIKYLSTLSKWNIWTYFISRGHVPLNSKHVIVFALEWEQTQMSVFDTLGDSFLTSIYPTFVLAVSRNRKSGTFEGIYVSCYLCYLEYIIFRKSSSFSDETKNELLTSYGNLVQSQIFIMLNLDHVTTNGLGHIPRNTYNCQWDTNKRGYFYNQISFAFQADYKHWLSCNHPLNVLLK